MDMKKQMRKILALCLVLCTMIALLTGCGEKPTPNANGGGENDVLTIKWASQNNPVMASGKTSLFTVDEISRLSDGKIQVDYYDNGKLGYDAELIQQVLDGTIPVVTVGVGVFSQYTDTMEAIQLPFLITNYDLEYEVVRSDEFKALLDATGEKLGLKLIGTQENGIRHFANNVRPINTIEDLAGMKIRVPQTTILMSTMEALGANPIPLAYNEIYTALQNKVVDGEEINFTSMEAQKHYEVVKYASTIGFYPYMAVTAINLDFWNSLTEEQQQIITEALENAEEKCFTEWIKENDETAQEVCSQEGVEINVIEDVDSFRDAVSGLYDEYESKGDLIKNFIESVEAKQ